MKNKMLTNQVKYILIASLLACLILYIFEQSIGVSYGIKTAIKLIFFVGIPLFYMKYIKKESFTGGLNIKRTRVKAYKIGLMAGILFFSIVLIAYLITSNQIDLSRISNELQTKLKVTPLNYILIATYITFGNSFLEEFFFRGFIFSNLYEKNYKKTAYIFSSLLFGVYHIAIFRNWFTLPIVLLALFGLISVGFLFCYMDTKSHNFINSWIAHIFADIAIVLIGFRMFGII